MTWTVQLGSTINSTPDFAKDNVRNAKDNVDVADTDDERVVERWEPGEIIDDDDDDGHDDGEGADGAQLFRGGGGEEDFLGRRTRSSQRRRRLRRRERQSAQVQKVVARKYREQLFRVI